MFGINIPESKLKIIAFSWVSVLKNMVSITVGGKVKSQGRLSILFVCFMIPVIIKPVLLVNKKSLLIAQTLVSEDFWRIRQLGS